MKLVDTAQMRELDRRTIEEFGTTGETLMERAGEGVAEAVRRMAFFAGYETPLIHLIAGRGNNGGDAFVAARMLKESGYDVEVWLAGRANQVTGDALLHLSRMKAKRIPCHELPTIEDWKAAMGAPVPADIVVDGVLGTGITGPARGPAAGAIQYINEQARNAPCVAIDVPSGLNADSGRAEGDAVMADLTVTMGLPKRGLIEPDALDFVGSLEVLNIGIPREYVEDAVTEENRELIHVSDIKPLFPRRPRVTHKGHYGHLLIIGGSHGYTGAVALAARAAMRSGVGLTTALVPRSFHAIVASAAPEPMVVGGHETPQGSLSASNWDDIKGRLESYDAILIGPGLSRSEDSKQLVERVVRESPVPVVVDADALSVMENRSAFFVEAASPLVLTPHPGEMARLLGKSVQEVQADRWSIASQAADVTKATVVLKGAGTMVAQTGRPVQINMTGNPGMATGGTGDVLAGLLAGLLAQGLTPYDAARAAVYLHGRAGDMASWRKCQASIIAGDVVEELPFAFRELTVR